jgi:hypothetical protein
MTNQTKIVLASITLIIAAGLLALSPSMIGNAQAQMYDNQYGYDNNYYQDDNRYSYEKNDPKSSHTDIQKIKCVNSNINVNGIDITQIPHDATVLAATNEGGVEGANTQNGNGLADRINLERNLVNICVNVNDNEQVKVSPPDEEEPQQSTATLTVSKIVQCDNDSTSTTACGRVTALITEDQFNILFTGANTPVVNPIEGSETGVDVTLDPGDYALTDIGEQSVTDDLNTLEAEFPTLNFAWIGGFDDGASDCDNVNDFQLEGTIAAGESQTCSIINLIQVTNAPR